MPMIEPAGQFIQRGIALIEVICAVALMSVSVLGILTLERSVELGLSTAQHKLRATNHIEAYFERVRTRSANSILSTAQVVDFDSDIINETIEHADGITLTVQVTDVMYEGSLKKLHVDASWQGDDGEIKSISANTMISRFSVFATN